MKSVTKSATKANRINDPFYMGLDKSGRDRFRAELSRIRRQNPSIGRSEAIKIIKSQWMHMANDDNSNVVFLPSRKSLPETAETETEVKQLKHVSETSETETEVKQLKHVSETSETETEVKQLKHVSETEVKQLKHLPTSCFRDISETTETAQTLKTETSETETKSVSISLKQLSLSDAPLSTIWANYKYSILKLLFYCAIVPTSAIAVHEFFESLNLYGHSRVNLVIAVILTMAVDYLAIDLLSKSGFTLRGLGNLVTALLVVAGNIALASQTISREAKIPELRAFEEKVSKKEAELKELQLQRDKAYGEYLAAKWRNSSDPFACEKGIETIRCGAPYINNDQTRALLTNFTSLDVSLKSLSSELTSLKSSTPLTSSAAESSANQRILLYIGLWSMIFICVYAQRPQKSFAG